MLVDVGQAQERSVHEGLDEDGLITVQVPEDLLVEGDWRGLVPDPDAATLDEDFVFEAVDGVDLGQRSQQPRNVPAQGCLDVALAVVLVSHQSDVQEALDCTGQSCGVNASGIRVQRDGATVLEMTIGSGS